MELHSYAKRKTAKKWSIEQKRNLVETRIQYDSMFYNKPPSHVLSWKRILALAKLDEYNVFFVRKQWSNMLAKYKQYKQNKLDKIPPNANVNEIIRIITQEWEFFETLHNFMTRKTQNNLHSYALTMDGIEIPKNYLKPTVVASSHEYMEPNKASEHIYIFSSDTNEDYAFETVITNDEDMLINSTDMLESQRDDVGHKQLNYFADASGEDSSNILLAMSTQTPVKELIVEVNGTMQTELPTTSTAVPSQSLHSTTKAEDEIPSTSSTKTKNKSAISFQKLSEREKYYRHKRHFNCRMEKRFDALFNVVGQIVKAEYPSINVTPLTESVGNVLFSIADNLFSSDGTDEEEEQEQNNDVKSSTNESCKKHKHQSCHGQSN